MAVDIGDRQAAEEEDRQITSVSLPCRAATSNRQLIDRCQDGDHEAWNELVNRYERLVYAIPVREGLSAEDAADISQTVFETLVQSLDRIRDPDRLAHWLMTVSRRLTWRRRSARRNEVSVGIEPIDAVDGPVDDGWERVVDIYDAVAELGEPCRSLIVGLFFDPAQPSYEELAVFLDMATGSIGPLRSRCLSRLRAVIEGEAA